jgi:hypothetical protein
MSKYDKYKEKAIQRIEEAQARLVESQDLFDKYAEQVKALDPRLFDWLEASFKMDQYWDNQEIENNNEYLWDLRDREETRRRAAIKAAATRKANKLKVA